MSSETRSGGDGFASTGFVVILLFGLSSSARGLLLEARDRHLEQVVARRFHVLDGDVVDVGADAVQAGHLAGVW